MCSLSSRYTAVEYARQLRAFVYEYDQVEGGYSALLTGTVDAVVSDAQICCTIRKIKGKGRWQWLASHVPDSPLGLDQRPIDHGRPPAVRSWCAAAPCLAVLA